MLRSTSMNKSKLYGIYQHFIQITFDQCIILAYTFMRIHMNVAKSKMLPHALLLLRIFVLKNRIGIYNHTTTVMMIVMIK